MGTIKKVAIWTAIIWGSNWAGSHGYRVGSAISWITGMTATAVVGVASAVEHANVEKK